jgi:uncharacterized protein YndB with AHSA1/START domain
MDPIRHDVRVNADAQTAYRAAATQAGIRGWWAKNSDVGETVGGKTELRFLRPDMTAVMKFEVTALEPGRRVEWKCTENSNPSWPGSVLTWEIEPAPQGSILHFRHEGFSSGGPPYDMTVQGWPRFIDSLKAYLDGGTPQPAD